MLFFQSSPQTNSATPADSGDVAPKQNAGDVATKQNAGGTAPKRARIEPPIFDDDDKKDVKVAAAKIAEDKPVAATGSAQKKRLRKKNKGGLKTVAKPQEPAAKVQPKPSKPLDLHTKKNSGVLARVGGPVKSGALKQTTPKRFQAGGQANRGFQNNRGGRVGQTTPGFQNSRTERGGQTTPRMARVPSPWAISPVQIPNWFGFGN